MKHKAFTASLVIAAVATLFQFVPSELVGQVIKPIKVETIEPIRNETFHKNGECRERRQGGNPRKISGLLVFTRIACLPGATLRR